MYVLVYIFVSFIFIAYYDVSNAQTQKCNIVSSTAMVRSLMEPREVQSDALIISFSDNEALRSFEQKLTNDPFFLLNDVAVSIDPDFIALSDELRIIISSVEARAYDQLELNVFHTGELLEALPGVEYVQTDYIFETQQFLTHKKPNDPCYNFQWHYWLNGPWSSNDTSAGGINLPYAWAANSSGNEIIVSVIDTGQWYHHPDIDQNVFVDGYDFLDNDNDPTDDDSGSIFHGTHVAGIVGSLISNNGHGATSVNWHTRIQPIRAIGSNGRGSVSVISNSILWAAGVPLKGVKLNSTPAHVINLSLGGHVPCKKIPILQRAITLAHNRGVLVVVAAGNQDIDVSGFSPAGCEGVLTVSASDSNGNLARYSNYGKRVAILAPGGDLNEDVNNDGVKDGVLSATKNGFTLYAGTSMAAPHVAGVAALLFSQDPMLTPDDVHAILVNGALKKNNQCPNGKLCGAGLLNAAVVVSRPSS